MLFTELVEKLFYAKSRTGEIVAINQETVTGYNFKTRVANRSTQFLVNSFTIRCVV